MTYVSCINQTRSLRYRIIDAINELEETLLATKKRP